MQEYRWFIRNRAALAIGADRGRFQTDSDAMESAELLLKQHPEAFVLEVWRGSKLISRIVSDSAGTPRPDDPEAGNR